MTGESDTFADAQLSCDIVMKGGITSGVVYPGAVLPLARKYRFRSIGGASAGGIAAAIVAAAEYGRAEGGFDVVEALPKKLGTDGFMLELFQPDPATRPLFSVLIGFLKSPWRGALAVVKAFRRSFLLALAVAVASILLSAVAGADAAFAVAGVFAATLILVIGLVGEALRAVGRIPDNHFGLCRLGPDVGTKGKPALTGWLHESIQKAAGRGEDGPPLTFAELWAGPGAVDPPRERVLELSRDAWLRAIDLQMMTTDLTHGRPLRLPVPYRLHEDALEECEGLLFKPSELRHFFPQPVLDHLISHGAEVAGHDDLRRFPIGPDLPVVVATRMTLSFPILISAIPLYELNASGELVRVLFSDGGITSNFPVHFFDSPLPTRPTFGLNLIGFEPGETPDPDKPCEAVRAPLAPGEDAFPSAARITGLPDFLVAIKDAMQNWRDNAQAELPGFRDRICHIKLAGGEGGLNLTMKADKITELNARGTCAGDHLVRLFAGDGSGKPVHWNVHRFVRYRTAMSLGERWVRTYARGYCEPVDAATRPYAALISLPDEHYAIKREMLPFARATTLGYVRLVMRWNDERTTLDDARVPRPPSTLRAVPPV